MPPRRLPARLLPVPVPVLLTAAAGAAAYAYYRRVYRYRDPVRLSPEESAAMVAPADGTVLAVRRISGGSVDVLDEVRGVQERPDLAALGLRVREGWFVALEIGLPDARYVYAPLGAQVTALARHKPTPELGLVLDTKRAECDLLTYSLEVTESPRLSSEGMGVGLLRRGGRLEATTYFEAGQTVRRGNKLAFLEAGDVVLLAWEGGDAAAPSVRVGERVVGAQSVVVGNL